MGAANLLKAHGHGRFSRCQVEAEIEAFGKVDQVVVSRSVNNSVDQYHLQEYTVTFTGAAVSGNVPQLKVVDLGSNGCGRIANATSGQVAGETVQEAFVPIYRVQNTEDLAFNAAAADVKAAIEALSGACKVDVSRTVRGNGYEWLVTFADEHKNRLLRAMRPNALLLDNVADVIPQVVIIPILRVGISTPKSGVPYYIRAAARNAVGAGRFRTSTPTSIQPASQPPGAPRFATVAAVSDTELFVQWESPISDGGESVSEFIVEWDLAETFDTATGGGAVGSALVYATVKGSIADVQAVRLSIDDGLYISGSFVLEYDGQRTNSMPFDASSVGVESALESLCTIGDVSVSRSLGPANGGYTWLVTIVAPAAGEDAGDGMISTTSALQGVKAHKLKADGENLLACGDEGRQGCWSDPDRTSLGVETKREMQRLLCQPTAAFTLSYAGESSSSLSQAANATDIEEALEAFYAIGDVTVVGSCDPAGNSYVYVTFENAAGDLPALSSTVDGDFEEVFRGSAQVVVGRKPFSYRISEISSTGPWSVRIAAYNRVGFGKFLTATHNSDNMVVAAVGAPTVPESVSVEVASAYTAWIYWNAPASDGGDTITSYNVQWDVSDTFDSSCGDGPEVQTISVSSENASHAGETFNVTIGDTQYGRCLEWDTGVFALQNDLRSGGSNLGAVVVTRGGDGSLAWNYGYTFSVTFIHNSTRDGLANVPEMQVVSCATGGNDAVFEVRTLKDGTEYGESACQVDNLRPFGSASVEAFGAEGVGDPAKGAFAYLATGLISGASYRARVSAENSLARSPWGFMGYSRTPTSFVPTAPPKLVRNITVAATGGANMMHVGLGLPFDTHANGVEGLPLKGFRIEMSRRVIEQQVIKIIFALDSTALGPAYPSRGSYDLSVGNATTWCLGWNSTAGEVELALDSLPTVDGISVVAVEAEVNSTGNSEFSESSPRALLVSFTGPSLSNGDQDLIGYSVCTSFDAGAYLDTYTITDGVAGVVSPIVVVSTHSVNDVALSGSYVLSFGARSHLGLRLGEGTDTAVHVSVAAASRTVYSSSDLAHYIIAGDLVSVDGSELVVAGAFSCEDTVAWDNIVDPYPCRFEVETPHPYGANGVPIYGASNSVGSVRVTSGRSKVLTDWDLRAFLVPGDAVVVRDPSSEQYFQSTIMSLTATELVIEDGYEGPSAARAAAFFCPYAVVPFDASAEELRYAIESLPSVGSAEVTRLGPNEWSAFSWSITLTSFHGPLSGAHTLHVTAETVRALIVSGCGDAGNGTFVATGGMHDGRMRYKLVDRPSYIEFDASADEGLGLWVVTSEGVNEPYAVAVLGAGFPARDSLVPPAGSASYWSNSCLVSLPTSGINLLGGSVTSRNEEVGAEGSFSSLAKDIITPEGMPEVQAIELGSSSDALDGTFHVDFGESGGFTAAWDISAEDMEVRGDVFLTITGCVGWKHISSGSRARSREAQVQLTTISVTVVGSVLIVRGLALDVADCC